MFSSDNRLEYLLQRYAQKIATVEEQEELSALLETDWDNTAQSSLASYVDWEKMLAEIEESAAVKKTSGIRFIQRRALKYAAAILLVSGIGAYLYQDSNRNKKHESVTEASEVIPSMDITPGGEKAVLTLADGSTILLDSASNGIISDQGAARVIKLADGKIVYQPNSKITSSAAYNTMRTPKGGQYQLTLPDGSKVWLNAASSITFPTAFPENERTVYVTGEVYFEVVSEKTRLFTARINQETEIQVLGTHFNINAYSDEKEISATLLKGSVRVVNGEKEKLIMPGEQASINAGFSTKNGINVSNVDTSAVMSWRHGVFNFDNKNLGEVMRQLSRWYDIEVIYENDIPDIELGGKLGKDLNLSEILEVLKQYEIHFRMEKGKRLVVLP